VSQAQVLGDKEITVEGVPLQMIATDTGGGRIKISVKIKTPLASITNVNVGEYLGQGTENKILLGRASKLTLDEWVFNWNTVNVEGGEHRIFPIVFFGERRIDGAPLVISLPSKDNSIVPEGGTNMPPSPIESTATVETIDTISEAIKDTLGDAIQDTENTLKKAETSINSVIDSLKEGVVDEKIISRIDQEKEIVKNAISTTITSTHEEIQKQIFSTTKPNTANTKKELQARTEENLKRLSNLANEVGKEIDVKRVETEILSEVERFERELEERRTSFERRVEGGLLLYIDSDKDGVSDYDEKNVYNINPTSPDSDKDGKIDSAEILSGSDPANTGNEVITYEDPKVSGPKTEAFLVQKIEVTETEEVGGQVKAKKIIFSGKALPNSFITVFIFSSPITVTVKTDINGQWEYVLDRELPDGNHEVYVASVDNSGKILAKSSGVSFVKQAAAVEILDFETAPDERPAILNTTSITVGLIVLLGIAVATFLIIGHSNKKRDEELTKMTGGNSTGEGGNGGTGAPSV
jgi:hypothetical protein